MNCLFLLVLLSCCNGFGGRRNDGCGCDRCEERREEREDCSCSRREERREEREDCGRREERREEREGCGCGRREERREEREGCGCDRREERREEREDCGCGRRFAESRPMPRYDDPMRGCSFGDSVPEMRQQGRMYPEG